MLQVNETVRILDIECCGLNEAAAKAMARALKRNKTLMALDISDNALGSHGVMALADTLATDNSTLRSISLDNTHAGVLGAEALARAIGANDSQYLLPNRTLVETYSQGAVDGRDYGEKMGDPRGE